MTRVFSDDRRGHDEQVFVERRVVRREAGERARGGDELRRRRHLDVDAVVADARLELVGRALRDGAAAVEDDDVVGEAVGFLEVLRREDERRAVADELAQQVPEVAAAPGVEAGGRLVEEEHLGAGDERRREVEAPAHAAREGLHELGGLGAQVHQLEQLVGALAGLTLGEAVEPADHLEVEAGAEQAVDGRLLCGDADTPAHRGRVVDDVEAGDGRPALGRRRDGREDAQGRRLAGAVVAEQTEDRAPGHLEIEVPQGPEVAEALAEPLGVHPGSGGGVGGHERSFGGFS